MGSTEARVLLTELLVLKPVYIEPNVSFIYFLNDSKGNTVHFRSSYHFH